MTENKLTLEQMRTLTALTNREKKYRAGQGVPLEEFEQEWRLQALMALNEGRALPDPYLPNDLLDQPEPAFKDKEVPGPVKVQALEEAAGVVPSSEFVQGANKIEEAVAEDVEAAQAEMSDEEIIEEVRDAMTKALKEQGLWDQYVAAKKKHGDVWVNSSNGVIFGFRKLLFKDIVEAGELNNLIEEMKMVADRCVVFNKEALIGDNPSAYVYEMIYQLVRAVSNARPDMAYSVKV